MGGAGSTREHGVPDEFKMFTNERRCADASSSVYGWFALQSPGTLRGHTPTSDARHSKFKMLITVN